MIRTEIPVKNFFYLLSYAWDMMHESSFLKVNYEKCPTTNDLFARILINGINNLIKKGLKKDYEPLVEQMGYIKGKILFKESIPQIMSNGSKLNCQHEELTFNILENQIIFQTLRTLLKKDIEKSLKLEINKLLRLSGDIQPIEIEKELFKKIPHRKSGLRALLINVCEIIYLASLPTYESGDKIFRDFINDEKSLGRLFETFIFNFYRKKLLKEYAVTREEIKWSLSPLNESSAAYLPKMRTDVIVQTKDLKIIIDTKFYKQTFQNFHTKDTIHSSNLYQIQSYLLHDSCTGEKKDRIGVLLYPTTKETPLLSYKYADGNKLQIHTINLGQDWELIESSLLNLIHSLDAE